MVYLVLTKGLLQLSPEAAMLTLPSAETRQPSSVLPFLLLPNLSPEDIAGSVSQAESCMTHISKCL